MDLAVLVEVLQPLERFVQDHGYELLLQSLVVRARKLC